MTFKELNLNPKLLRAVDACGFKTPTDIQREAIPVILAGCDLMASSQTGTGKTAAFVLPALQRLLKPSKKPGIGPRILVLTPTRELATQINNDIRQFSRFCRMTSGNVLGGMPYPPQIRLLKKPVDLLVATPGRLMDHMKEGRVDFTRLEVFVLDEADRMLDLGFVNAVRNIAAAMPKERQTLLFSATLEGAVLAIAKALMDEPETIQLTVKTERHELINQRVFQADSHAHKYQLLSRHLKDEGISQALIFTATKRGADSLGRSLSVEGLNSAVLHGDMRQNLRRKTVARMREGDLQVLVATDVAARGLDLKGVSHVINYDVPGAAEDYIHRIGRTGRAGVNGTAITLVGPGEWGKWADIERMTKQQIGRETIPGLEPKLPEPRIRRTGASTGRSWRPRGTKGRRGGLRRPRVTAR